MKNHWRRQLEVAAVLVVYFLLVSVSVTSVHAEAAIEIVSLSKREGRIAFAHTENNNSDIHLLDLYSLRTRSLIATKAQEANPRWSPDGKYLAFDSDQGGTDGIYVFSMLFPKEPAKLIAQLPGARQPDWSPDGSYVVFSAKRSDGQKGNSLYLANADGSSVKELYASEASITSPRWSPRGTEIVFSSNHSWPGWDLVVLDLNAKTATTLTKGVQSFVRPSWSMDSGALIFSYGSAREFDLWTLSRGDAEVKKLLSLPGREFDAEWILQQTLLLFVAEDSPGSEKYELFTFDPNSEKVEQVTRSKGSIRNISWSPYPLPPMGVVTPDTKEQASTTEKVN